MRQALKQHCDLVGAGLMVVTWGPLLLLPNGGALRLASGLVFAFFLPGYLFLAALERDPSSWGRPHIACAAPALSVAIVTTLGIVLAMLSWLRLSSVGILLLVWNLSWLLVAVRKRSKSSEPRASRPAGQHGNYSIAVRRPVWNTTGVGFCAAVILVSVAWLRLIARSAESNPAYTELFLVETGAEVGVHHSEASPGELLSFTVGIVNREGEALRYRVDVCPGSVQCQSSGEISLEDGGEARVLVGVRAPDTTGPAKIVIRLLRENQEAPYRQVHAWIQVH